MLPSELTNTIECVCVRVRACVRVCVHACVRAFKRIHVAAYRDQIWHTHADSSTKGMLQHTPGNPARVSKVRPMWGSNPRP